MDLVSQLQKKIENCLYEALKRSKREIFTISIDRVYDESEYEYMPYTTQNYYSEDDVLNDAHMIAEELRSDEDLLIINVFCGEYETPSGDVFGEPYAFFTISNKSKEETIKGRKDAGFINPECDEYAD